MDKENGRVLVRQVLEDELRGRDEVEREPSMEQIFAFFVLGYQDRVLLIRNPIIGEGKRQGNLFSLGIRGHFQEEDLDEKLSIWGEREFRRQIDYQGSLRFEVLGVLNDENDSLGVIILAKGDSPLLQMREKLKRPQLVTLPGAFAHRSFMDNLSKTVFDFLRSQEKIKVKR